MKTPYKLLAAGASLCLFYTAPSVSQDDSVLIDEIVITGRKREESLQEVPVSISVLGASLIGDAGIVTQQDLFDMTPGIHYDEGFDRNAALPSVRGVQSNEVATNRTKVTAFIDGMPTLGSQGNINFGGIQQVEVYRGPQSAAFGRSTFGGAINYITKDPGEEFEANIGVDVNDYGRRIVNGGFGGPLTDNIGYLIDGSWEDSTSPDEFLSSDGIQYGERTGTTLSAKFVFNPTDELEVELAFSHVETDDTPTIEHFISEASRDACWDGSYIPGGMFSGVYARGDLDCGDWDIGIPFQAQNDRAAFLESYSTPTALAALAGTGSYADLASQAADARAAGATDDSSVTGTVESDILAVASGYSLGAEDVGGENERDRVQLQVDYGLNNDGAIQLSAMYSEETYVRHYDESGTNLEVLDIDYNPGTGLYGFPPGMATVGTIMSDPSEIEENYVELRYVSPSEDRLRYVVGASLYDYSFLTAKYFDNGYGVLLGLVDGDDFLALTGIDQPNDPTLSNISEEATNTGLFGSLMYDFTDKATLTLEARYQKDEVSTVDTISGNGGEVSTTAFLPRISFNYNIDDNTSWYAQISEGNNPGGLNSDYFSPSYIERLNSEGEWAPGNTNGPDDTEQLGGQSFVSYTAETFQTFEEETLTNYEVGIKGSSENGKFQYAAAIFLMDWQDQASSVNLSWSTPDDMTAFAGSRTFLNGGDVSMKGIEFEGTWLLTDNWNVRGTFSWLDAKYTDYCDAEAFENGFVDFEDGFRTLTVAGDGVDYDCTLVNGSDVDEQPPLSGSISPSYTADLGETGLTWTARADLRYEAAQWLDTVNYAKSPSVTTLNFSAGLNADNWGATLYVNNLTDNSTPLRFSNGTDYSLRVADVTTDLSATGQLLNDASAPDETGYLSNYKIVPRQERTVGLRLNYNF